MSKTIEDVKKFWEDNPLWAGESKFPTGSLEFFEEHRNVYINDCFAGKIDPRIFPDSAHRRRVLDLGCGPGFWTVELVRAGCEHVIAADLTENALKLTQERSLLYGVNSRVETSIQNAESLTFEDATFTHVNCQGVIHHTPNTHAAVEEIARVLCNNGTALISVYYRNIILQSWPIVKWPAKIMAKLGAGLSGRGREDIYRFEDIDEIVRLYDGRDNPIGKHYSRRGFEKMLSSFFTVESIFFHFFPARSLPFRIPRSIHSYLDKRFGFMIYALLSKK